MLFAHADLYRRMSPSVVFFAKIDTRQQTPSLLICEGATVSATRYSSPTLHNVLKHWAPDFSVRWPIDSKIIGLRPDLWQTSGVAFLYPHRIYPHRIF
jgi:hypothetical protein